jgi:hypothetical protein
VTTDEIRAMEAGRALDTLIAEHVMGLRVVAHDWPYWLDPECGGYEAAMGRYDTDSSEGAGPVYVPEHGKWPPSIESDLDRGEWAIVKPVPFYSDDIAAAWQVVERLLETGGFSLERQRYGAAPVPAGMWKAYVWGVSGVTKVRADTAPLAICRAALLAVQP